MIGSTLVFDLETKYLAHEVGGWSNIDKLGLAAAVLLVVETDVTYRFLEQDVEELISQLLKADQIVGFNIVRFDYQVLRPYGLATGSDLIRRTVDLMDHIYQSLGFRISLDNLAEATLGEHKSADGLAAVKWYREGKLDQVLDYCEQDVRITHRLWEYGRHNGQIKYRDRESGLRTLAVSW